MSARRYKRPSRSKQQVFTVVYHGERNRFIMSEDIRASGIEEAELRARRSLPPEAIRFRVIDQSEEIRRATADLAAALRGL